MRATPPIGHGDSRGHSRARRLPRPAALAALAAAIGLVAAGCSETETPGDAVRGAATTEAATAATVAADFVDIAAAAGVDFRHQNGAEGELYYPELMHAAGALVDLDDDGWLDIYLVQSGPLPVAAGSPRPGNRLFRNRGPDADGRLSFEDVTQTSGTGDGGYGTGVAAGDYDGDGRLDLYVTNLGRNTLLRNAGRGEDGTLRFADLTSDAGVGDEGYSTAAAFVDFDRDGLLDLYVVNYIDWSPRIERHCLGFNGQRGYCSPLEYDRPQHDRLYRNLGPDADGTVRFEDVSDATGIRATAGTGLGVVTADFDGDGLVDIYVANDQMANHLWIQQNADAPGPTFVDEGMARGAAVSGRGRAEAGMGVAAEDPDDDGDWDLFLAHISSETNTYYENEDGDFLDRTDELGLGSSSLPYTGFGTGFFDYDNDGHLDIFVANGKVRLGDDVKFDYREPNLLYRGSGERASAIRKGWHRVEADFLDPLEVSRSTAFGDIDNDGDVDLLVVNNGGPPRLYENRTPSTGGWLVVEARQKNGSWAQGAVVEVDTGARTLRRRVASAYSYGAASDLRVHFGLGEIDTVPELRVVWTDGTVERRGNVAAGRTVVVRRGDAGEDAGP